MKQCLFVLYVPSQIVWQEITLDKALNILDDVDEHFGILFDTSLLWVRQHCLNIICGITMNKRECGYRNVLLNVPCMRQFCMLNQNDAMVVTTIKYSYRIKNDSSSLLGKIINDSSKLNNHKYINLKMSSFVQNIFHYNTSSCCCRSHSL